MCEVLQGQAPHGISGLSQCNSGNLQIRRLALRIQEES